MNNKDVFSKEMAIRGLLVSGLVIGFGYSFYGNEIFTPTMWPSQFFFSGITLAISNAFFHNKQNRNGAATLLVWYMVSVGLISHIHNRWNYVLYIVDIAVIAGSVYLFYVLARKPFLTHRYQQIIAVSILVGLANSLTVVFLGILHLRVTFAHLGSLFQSTYLNLKIGVLMGLLLGIGNLASDAMFTYIRSHRRVAG